MMSSWRMIGGGVVDVGCSVVVLGVVLAVEVVVGMGGGVVGGGGGGVVVVVLRERFFVLVEVGVEAVEMTDVVVDVEEDGTL
jgi:hypothetical protein